MKKACLEYAGNIKILDGRTISIFQQTKKFDKAPKETKIDELYKQVENLHLMMMKQPRIKIGNVFPMPLVGRSDSFRTHAEQHQCRYLR